MNAPPRTPVSSPVSAATSASPVSTAALTPLSGTTAKNFTVAKYVELQEKKLELEGKKCAEAAKTASPKTVFDGSSVLSTDGGISEEGQLEDEGTSSSPSRDSEPVAGTRRPREADSDASASKRPQSFSDAVSATLEALAITSDPAVVPSEQRDALRTDDSVREPWMPSESVITARYRRTVPPNVISLYVDSRIVDDAEAASKHIEPMTDQRRGHHISHFYEPWYWNSKKTSG
ncbi:hypothetical protein PHMEG_00010458 [Phytophthora megakarya]|uniref:Uncharacterized protein n=1 Tax=Phytophthora megakarya TaxID=4795 RepID=A0A225WFE0_9STRA|nr:hypothetical protein PHMEG_00010458 [Phytophthora megakarya]